MKAIHIHPPSDPTQPPYSPTNPAPSTALRLSTTTPVPQPRASDLLVRIKATSIIRDTLTWPEMYVHAYAIPGHDFAGVVEAIPPDVTSFKVGDEVFGMVHPDRGGTWAEYALISVGEAARKPEGLGWGMAAGMPLSGLTAYQALFVKAGLATPGSDEGRTRRARVLVTGASGGVGMYLVQLASWAGYAVTALSGSKGSAGERLRGLGASEVRAYGDVEDDEGRYDVIVDTIGGAFLERCWALVSPEGSLVSVDSASFDFVNRHTQAGLVKGKEKVNALFFIVQPCREHLEFLAEAVESGHIKCFVAAEYPLEQAREAYEACSKRSATPGKIILTV